MNRNRTSLAASLLLAGMFAAPAVAGEPADLAASAEEMAAAGDHAGALETMREGFLTLWRTSPLTFTEAVFVSAEPSGYGVYEPRDNNVFAAGETLLIYTEPAGFGWEAVDDHFRSDLTVDFEVRTPDGNVLGGQREFGRFTFESLVENTEYMARVSISLTGAEPGEYVLGLTFHDMIDGDNAVLDLPFEIQ